MRGAYRLLPLASCCLLFLLFFIIWIGVFFGATFHEIIVKETYLPTQCTVIKRNINSYRCCSSFCSLCSSCALNTRTCSDVESSLGINQTEACCNGYQCCSQCCQTCQSCSNDGQCTSYECNCYCCESVEDLDCTIECNECWNPVITVQYETLDNVTVVSSMKKDCVKDFTCVDQYFELWKLNKTSTCYYNPQSTSEFETTNAYSPDKFGAMYAFAALSLLTGIICVILSCVEIAIQVVKCLKRS